MKKQDFTKEKDADLMNTLTKKREELRMFRFGTAGSATRDVKALHTNKKDVARILTELAARSRHA
jgi:ribosomal protein L29